MSAPPIRTIICQPIALASTTTIGTVTDADGARAVSLAAGTYRIKLVKSTGGSGTEADPWDLLAKIKAALNAGATGAPWTVPLSAAGYAGLGYSGVGAADLAWHAGHVVRNVLGFAADLVAFTSATAPQQPTHVVYGFGEVSDTQWFASHDDAACGTRGNDVYARNDETALVSRVIKYDMVPRDASTIAAFPGHSSASPYQPAKSRLRTPGGAPGTAGPWSWMDLVSSARGKRLAANFGLFQEAIAGAVTTYDAVKLDPETCQRGARPSLKVQDWNQFLLLELGFRFLAEESLT